MTTMHLRNVDLNLFVVFETVYAERNLTRAAEALFVTQPAISNALTRLRKILDDPLFIKTNDGMQPTAFAESIAGRVSDALSLLQAVSQSRNSFRPETSQRIFRMKLLDLHDAMILPKLTQVIRQTAPGVELRTLAVPRSEITQALSRGVVELAIDIPLQDTTNLIETTLASERYVCAMRPDHPLADQKLDLDQYMALSHLHISSRPQGLGTVDVALRKLGLRRNLGVRLHSYLSAPEIIRNTDMAVTITEGWARDSGLVYAPLPIDLKPMEIRLYRHVRSEGDTAIDWLIQQIEHASGVQTENH